ncbi:hypothetical protein CTheo_5409 [Ceratobasidium theobromae]|uniref:F-box domain-containing protein n=1 Tax=Ceratobasidium theobromae TaxID=1582974 RepID=A0A5N5QI50_9AGAM|nr:hypothetical protein CTheo_5409 [Ceratobasidium theobromae]
MQILQLPPEVLLMIARVLSDDSVSLRNLCLANKATYSLLCPVLYQRVQLSSASAVTSFCCAATSSRLQSANYTVLLQIGPPVLFITEYGVGFRLRKDLVPQLRDALEVMPNLRSLSLSTTRKALVLLLNDFKPPFQLYEMEHSVGLSTPLLRFWEKQPSIKKIGWRFAVTDKEVYRLSGWLTKNPNLLPQLNEVSGDFRFVASLVVLRPISKILISGALDYILAGPWMDHTMRPLSVPISSVCFTEPRHNWFVWRHLLQIFRDAGVCSTIRDLCVVDMFSGTTDLENLHMPGALEDFEHVLKGFDALERLEIHGPLAHERNVRRWLAEKQMECLSAWTRAPSLKSAIIYNYELQ